MVGNNGSKEEIEMWPNSEYIPKTEPRVTDNTLEEDLRWRRAKTPRIWMGTTGRMTLSCADMGNEERTSLNWRVRQAVRIQEITFKTLVIDPTRQVDKQISRWGG